MAPVHPTAREEREEKVRMVFAFASKLTKRFASPHDGTLADDIQVRIRGFPLPASPAVTAKQQELEQLGTELWNLANRVRSEEDQPNKKDTEDASGENRARGLLRVYAFLLLDSAGTWSIKGFERQNCIRLMKIALRTARWCMDGTSVEDTRKVLERAAEYQEVLRSKGENDEGAESELGERLRVEYFTLRTALAWRSNRMDTAEHMFTKCQGLSRFFTASLAEGVSDLLYEMGKDLLKKRSPETAIQWLERAHDVLGEQNVETRTAEASELRLSIMQSIALAYINLEGPEARTKARHWVQVLEADFEDKMSINLLKLELLFSEIAVDADQIYLVLHRIIRSIVLSERNFKTVLHHIRKLKDIDNVTACKLLDELIETRLFREEKEAWIERAVVTRVWISCTTSVAEGSVDQLQELLGMVLRNAKAPFSAKGTHAAQTLIWKQVEANFSQGQHQQAESWCGTCLHNLFEKAGEINKSRISRKMIQCALARHDHAAAREVYSKMSESGREDRMTRYLMYKVALYADDLELAVECLGTVCRQSTVDISLLYACVVEAQQSGHKRQSLLALEKLLEEYNDNAPADVNLPALIRLSVRLLRSELVKDGALDQDVYDRICKLLVEASAHATGSRRRPSNPSRAQFDSEEFEWFSKITYNMAIKYCGHASPQSLVKLLTACVDFIKLYQGCEKVKKNDSVHQRLMTCHYLLACAFAALARADDNTQDSIQHYLQVSKYGSGFRSLGTEFMDKLVPSAKADMTTKHFQVVKLELEAALKREQWEELDGLFEECWKYGGPARYDKLADLVLIIYSCMSKENVNDNYKSNALSVLQKIINLSGKSKGFDMVKMARWIRCLFQLAFTYDETVSLKCLDHAIRLASIRKGTLLRLNEYVPETPPPSSPRVFVRESDTRLTDECYKEPSHYPITELEWLATTSFNHAVDYYVYGNDVKCKQWAEKALTLADWAEGDELAVALLEKYKGLTWGDEE